MTFGKNPRRVRSRKDERDPMDRFLADRRREALAVKAETTELPEPVAPIVALGLSFRPQPELCRRVGKSYCCD